MSFISDWASWLVIVVAVSVVAAIVERRPRGPEAPQVVGGAVSRALRWVAAIALRCFAAFLAWVLALSFVLLSEPGWFMSQSDDYDDLCWLTNTRLVDWLFIGAIQVGLLALGVAAMVGASWILGRATWAGDRGGRARVLHGAAVWAAAVAVTALIDLRHYVMVWVSWANYTAEECGTTYAYPTKPIAIGAMVAFAIATAAILLAITLLRRGRRRGVATEA